MPNFRVTFSKDDVLVYISHLDLNHAFIRALNRADVKLKFSEGFNPHPKLVFALPLSVGMAGENELLYIGVADDKMSAEKLHTLLEKQIPEHIVIKKVEETEKKLKDVHSALYTIEIEKAGICDELEQFFKKDITVLKKTKSGEKNVCISPGIKKIGFRETDGKTIIETILDATAASYLNPELIMRALTDAGTVSQNDAYLITRKEIFLGE